MAGYRCVNFYDLCRLCSSVAGEKNVPIYSNENLLKKIKECLSVTLNEKDKLPKIICPSCEEYVEVFSEFRKSCSNAQKMLESCLNSTKLRNGGQVYIKDEMPSKKVLKPIPNVNIIATTPTKSTKKSATSPNQPDFLSSIMQAVGIQTGEDITESSGNLSQHNLQQHQTAVQTLPHYTLTLDTLKPGQIQYKIENANNILAQSPIITAKNLQDIQNQQVTLNQVDEFLKLKPKPSIIVKKEVPAEDRKDKKPKFNLILQATPQKQISKIQPPQILPTTKAPSLSTQHHKAQILNIEKILPMVSQTSPTKQVVVPIMVRTSEGRNSGGDSATHQLLTQALSLTANHATENKTSIQQPFYMQMKLQSNADGQLTFTPATTAAPQQIQLSLSPQQLQQLSFQATTQPSIQTQSASTAQDIQTQTTVSEESREKVETNEEEIFNDTSFDNDYYPMEEENESHDTQEKLSSNAEKKTTQKKSLKMIKPMKLKSKTDSNAEIPSINPEHSEIAKKQLSHLTNFNNNNSKRVENENIDKSSDINLTVCDVCKKVFKRKEFLSQHLKSHIGLRPFKCEEAQCNKSFSRKEHLLRHISSHTGKKEFTCNICNKLFSRKDNLNKHRRIHPDIGQQNSRQKPSQIIKTESSCDEKEDTKDKVKTIVKKIKVIKGEEKKEQAIRTLTIQNQIPHQQGSQQQPKILQVQQIGLKNDNPQQIILSMSQAQAMLSQQSKSVYTIPTNFILNPHNAFVTPNSDLVGNLKLESQ